ncbi:hypothetical protein D3C75_1143360 [compost metagenome]
MRACFISSPIRCSFCFPYWRVIRPASVKERMMGLAEKVSWRKPCIRLRKSWIRRVFFRSSFPKMAPVTAATGTSSKQTTDSRQLMVSMYNKDATAIKGSRIICTRLPPMAPSRLLMSLVSRETNSPE